MNPSDPGDAAAQERTHRCFGCGARVPDIDGPTHAYIGASPGCWAIYTDILGLEYGAFRNPPCHRLTVDAYAVQHPGTPERRSIQSLAGHLVSLHLVLERGLDARQATRAIARVIEHSDRFVWLEPPPAPTWLTVLDVVGAADLASHDARVRAWARSAWEGWGEHHATVRRWSELAERHAPRRGGRTGSDRADR